MTLNSDTAADSQGACDAEEKELAFAYGVVTRYTSDAGNVGLYISANSNSPCPSGWYYVVRTDFANADDFKLVATSALAVYSMSKPVALFCSTSTCSLQRFSTIDTFV